MDETLLAGTILAFTLVMVLARPWGLSRAWWAAVGGGAVVLLGLITPSQALDVLAETADPLALVVGMMALSNVAERAGLFDRAASLAVRAGGGRARTLFVLVFGVGCLVTAVLSLDTTAVVLTPIVYDVVSKLGLRPAPFMFACVYAANTASLFLPVSNLTNLLAYNAFDLDFGRFALVMFLPAILAVAANLLVFGVLFRNDLRGSYDATTRGFVPEDPAFFRVTAAVVAGILPAFFVAPLAGVPVGTVALAAGFLLTVGASVSGWVEPAEVARSVSWDVLALVVGLFLVVRAVEGAGLGDLVENVYGFVAAWDTLPQILAVASATALGSNVFDNLPMTLLALDAAGPAVSEGRLGPAAVYATIIGTGVGPNLTIVGSLATLIWLSIVRGKGAQVTAKDYLKVGLIATPPIVLAACAGLWISSSLFLTP